MEGLSPYLNTCNSTNKIHVAYHSNSFKVHTAVLAASHRSNSNIVAQTENLQVCQPDPKEKKHSFLQTSLFPEASLHTLDSNELLGAPTV